MDITFDIATGHARALAHNFRNAHPNASPSAIADYVATHMSGDRHNGITGFMERADNAQDLPTDYDSWYANTIVNL